MSSVGNVMIVNDDSHVLNTLKGALQSERIQTVAFNDPKSAIDKIRADPKQFSVIIVNYGSIMRGSQRKFARIVKGIASEIRVILTSGYDSSPVDLEYQGYDAYLKIPVATKVLVFKVKEMLSNDKSVEPRT